MLDRSRYPRTASWLSALPEGLDSYPKVQVKTEAHEGLRQVFRDAGVTSLPAPFQAFLDGRSKDEWMPEVHGNALLLMARDRAFRSDEDFLGWVSRNMEELSLHPVYRMMMRMFSATLVVMGTARRWGTFHKGTEMEAAPVETIGGRNHSILTLSHPPGLYNQLLLDNLCTLYSVVLKACHAEAPRAQAERINDAVSRFDISWKV